MFNSVFFFGMVCKEPTWVTKDGKDELQFIVSSVDKEKMRSQHFEGVEDNEERPEINYVQIPVIVSNANFGEKLMNERNLGKGSLVYVEGSITNGFGSAIAVAARTIKVERSKPKFQQNNNYRENLEEQPPINHARKNLPYGRVRNE